MLQLMIMILCNYQCNKVEYSQLIINNVVLFHYRLESEPYLSQQMQKAQINNTTNNQIRLTF